MESTSHLNRLAEIQEIALRETDIKIRQFQKYLEDYESLKMRLLTLADKVSYDVMVPFGSIAFIPGTLIHTNEISVLFGDNYFVERSTKQSSEIVERRIQSAKEELCQLEKQKDLIKPRLKFTSDLIAQSKSDIVEIREDYDEENERIWQIEHRLNVMKRKKKEKEEEVVVKDEEWLSKRFDQLEKEYKKLDDDFMFSDKDSDVDVFDEHNHQSITSDEHIHSRPIVTFIEEHSHPNISSVEQSHPSVTSVNSAIENNNHLNQISSELKKNSVCQNERTVLKEEKTKSVRWKDTEKEEDEEEEEEKDETSDESEEYVQLSRSTLINFVHTRTPVPLLKNNRSIEDVILSPADIGSFRSHLTSLKSILKKSKNVDRSSVESTFPKERKQNERTIIDERTKRFDDDESLVNLVKERNIIKSSSDSLETNHEKQLRNSASEEGQKKISKFKASRIKKN